MYYTQVQGQLLILDMNFCDFFIWTPLLNTYVANTLLVRVHLTACDRSNCKVEWYHYACVKVTRAPKGSWICPPCLVEVSTQSCSEK